MNTQELELKTERLRKKVNEQIIRSRQYFSHILVNLDKKKVTRKRKVTKIYRENGNSRLMTTNIKPTQEVLDLELKSEILRIKIKELSLEKYWITYNAKELMNIQAEKEGGWKK